MNRSDSWESRSPLPRASFWIEILSMGNGMAKTRCLPSSDATATSVGPGWAVCQCGLVARRDPVFLFRAVGREGKC